jgi:hypothetical protein
MKRQFTILFALAAALVCLPMNAVNADGGHGHGRGHGHGGGNNHGHKAGFGHSAGFGHNAGFAHRGVFGQRSGFGLKGFGHGGFGIGGFVDDDSDFAELYRELYNNLPYFALHPPVYYSYPVPRTYGYSPFAYPPHVMTPEVVEAPQPVTIINPHVPNAPQKQVKTETDRSAAISAPIEPLIVINPFVATGQAVAQSDR